MRDLDFKHRVVETPVGDLWLVARGDRLWSAEFPRRWDRVAERIARMTGIEVTAGVGSGRSRLLTDANRALVRYFAGELTALESIPLDLEGSPFQKKVWMTVRKVKPGRVISYAKLAERARNPGAFRATGAANGANPCALFVPCHRVVSTSGTLTGYGGGIRAKAFLLEHEGVPTDGGRLAG